MQEAASLSTQVFMLFQLFTQDKRKYGTFLLICTILQIKTVTHTVLFCLV